MEYGVSTQLFEYSEQTSLYFCLCSWVGNEVCERKVDTVDELFGRPLDGAASIKER